MQHHVIGPGSTWQHRSCPASSKQLKVITAVQMQKTDMATYEKSDQLIKPKPQSNLLSKSPHGPFCCLAIDTRPGTDAVQASVAWLTWSGTGKSCLSEPRSLHTTVDGVERLEGTGSLHGLTVNA